MPKEKVVAKEEPVPDTCGDAFKNAWDCYSMQYQMTLYYRYGELDSCSGRWEAVMACMDKDKRKGESLSAKAPVDLGRAKSKPYWDLMTREEAGKRWRAAFGDAPGAVPSEQEAKRRAAKAAAKAAADVEGAEKR